MEKELFIVISAEVARLESWKHCNSTADHQGGCSSSGTDTAKCERKGSTDSGVVELLPELKDINVVDLDKEDLMRRQSSGVWSDFM